ncbi:MAG: pentapeptide repeat-containing protein [Alphaproteobacteria bacterium]
MADAKSKEELERDWWAAWRAEDYSWDGLAQKRWDGWSVILATGEIVETEKLEDGAAARLATLQDYWRDEEPHLIQGDGKSWTRAHCPLAWADGAPTPKAAWGDAEKAALEALFSAKLGEAAETKFEGPSYNRNLIGADRRAQFQGCTLFGAPAHPKGGANLLSVRFERACFSGYAGFGSATFSGDAVFDSATFSGDAGFGRATFSGYAGFRSATFSGNAGFRSATFSGDAGFGRATFSGNAGFDSATFSGYAGFDSATFSGNAHFGGAKFAGRADLRVKTFAKAARFADCLFMERADFGGAPFGGDMDFTAAVFEKLASFENIKWPQAAGDWHAAFDQALFRGTAVFTGAGFKALAAFDGAALERGVQIDDAREDAAKAMFAHERDAARAAAKPDAEAWAEEQKKEREEKEAKPVTRGEIAAKRRDARETRLKQLERGCRVLKQAMEYSSNKTREQMLYRFELQARRAQADTPVWEKGFSYLYAAASDYGASMARPFVALAVILALFTAIFYGLALAFGLTGDDAVKDAWQAFDLSFADVFKPLSALTAEGTPPHTLGQRLLTETGPGWNSGIRVLATIQSLFAIVLAFLFALAVRRRFQIS